MLNETEAATAERETREKVKRERRANMRLALLSGFMGALLTSGASIMVPPLLEHKSNRDHIDAMLQGVSATDPTSIYRSLNHVVPDSPADRYLSALYASADAYDFESEDSDLEELAGEQSSERDRACLPEFETGLAGCYNYTDFIFDSDTGLIQSFAIDGVPVAAITGGFRGDDNRMLTKEGETAPFSVHRYAQMTSPDRKTSSYAFSFKNTAENGQGALIVYESFVDRNYETVTPKTKLPTWVGPYATLTWSVKMQGDTGGFARVCVAPGEKWQTWGEVSADMKCHWVLIA